MATQLFLLRHGETAWSLTGQHTGRTDLPLTKSGEQRATKLRDRLQGIAFDHVLTSPLLRARQTCELAGFASGVCANPDLQEWDYGAYEGLTTDEIRVRHPGWNVFRHGCPQGESVGQVSQRADRALTAISALDGTVAVFSHGHFLRALAVRWIDLPVAEGQHFALATGSLSTLAYEHSDKESPVISLWNAI